MESRNKPVAFIDVDGTLIKMGKDLGKDRTTLNLPLIDALKDIGLTNIYLFTNMNLDTLANEFNQLNFGLHRKQIVDELQKQGFIVHGVITPADVGYRKGLGAVYSDFYLTQYQRVTDNEIPALKDMHGYAFIDDNSFNKADLQVREFKKATDLQLREYANIPKLAENTTINIKMAMYDYALGAKPEWIGSIIIIDDEDNCLKSVTTMHEYRGNHFPIKTIKIHDATHPQDPFVSTNFAACKQDYQAIMQEFLKRLPESERPPAERLQEMLTKLENVLCEISLKNEVLDAILQSLVRAKRDMQSPFATLANMKCTLIEESKPAKQSLFAFFGSSSRIQFKKQAVERIVTLIKIADPYEANSFLEELQKISNDNKARTSRGSRKSSTDSSD